MLIRRVGLLGDVHCETASLQRAIASLKQQQVDAVLCVGDIVDGAGDADQTLEMLQTHGVLCVAGNHERWFLNDLKRSLPHATLTLKKANRAFVASLPRTLTLETPLGPALLCHGVGDDDEAELHPETSGYALQEIPTLRDLMLADTQYMLGGHTHRKMVRRFQGLVVVNAGTLHPKRGPEYALIDFDQREVHFFDIGSTHVTLANTEELPLPAPIP